MIENLALILGVAALVIFIFKWLKQPVVLGYLVAGFLVSPHVSLFGSFIDEQNVQLWGELGVIFLLFALGLEFSFKRLMRVGGTAGLTTLFEVLTMLGIGFLVGRYWLGWNLMDSLFLGGITSISSTSIILRTLDELGFKNRKFVGLVLGVLVIEDLFAILLLVLLSTVALTRQLSGFEMLTSIAKLGFFLLSWFTVGIFLLPGTMRRSKKILSEETLLIISLGLCLVMVVFANKVGLSSALGAFVTGSLLGETVEGERIHHIVKPVKDLFSAVFFISVGMLIDPFAIGVHWHVILLIAAVVIVGKTLSVTFGALLSGQSLRHSLQTGMSLSQIGEFSFIIATLGLSFGVISKDLYPIAVTVSIVTAFTTPHMMKLADPLYKFLEKVLPSSWSQGLYNYERVSFALTTNRQWRSLIKAYLLKILLNGVVATGFFLFISQWVYPWLLDRGMEIPVAKFASLSLALLFGAPFLWAMAFGRTKNIELIDFMIDQEIYSPNFIFVLLRTGIAIGLLAIMLHQFVSWFWAIVITIWMAVAVGVVLYSHLEKLYQWFETRFLGNLNGDDSVLVKPFQPRKVLAPWDAHITEFEVPQDAPYIGEHLHTLSIREKYGVTIAMIERGRSRILAPGRDEYLMPFDSVFVIGNDEQIARFKDFIESQPIPIEESIESHTFSLEKTELADSSPFIQKTIRDSGLREKTHGLVVGIERHGERILNPDSSMILEAGDLLWIVGDSQRIRAL